MIRVKWYDHKWSKIAMRYGVYACAAAGVLFAVWYYGLSDRNITTVTVVPDPRLNYATRKSIEEFVQQFCLKSPDFYTHLKETFSCVKDVNSVRKKRNHMYIKFAAHMPVVAINNSHIVTANGLLIGVQFYRSDIIITLPQIVIEHDVIPAELCQLANWAVTIPDFLRTQATILWKNPTEIHLLFKEYPKNAAIISIQTDLSEPSINAIKRVIALDHVATVDARFDGMLVARMDKKIKTRRKGS